MAHLKSIENLKLEENWETIWNKFKSDLSNGCLTEQKIDIGRSFKNQQSLTVNIKK